MISITFGLGEQGTTEFFPDTEFLVVLEEDTVSVQVEAEPISVHVIEDSVTVVLEEVS